MIGSFDESHVVFGCLPACLRNGGNPVPYGIKTNQTFPFYNGPAAPRMIQGYENGNLAHPAARVLNYADGSLVLPNPPPDTFYGYALNPKGYQFVLDSTSTWSMSYTIDFSQPSPPDFNAGVWLQFIGDTIHQYVGVALFSGVIEGKITAMFSLDEDGTFTNYSSMLWELDNVSGVQNLVFTKNGTDLKLYQNGVLIPVDWVTTNDPFWSSVSMATALTDAPKTFPSSLSYYDTLPTAPEGQGLPMLSVIGANFWGLTNRYSSFLMYDKEISQSEVTTLYGLGPDLGGLYGYDNGNGTMALQDTRNRYYVGGFETTDVIFGCLPSCLQEGGNPVAYGLAPNGTNRPKFPLFRGFCAPAGLEGDVPVYTHYRPNDNRLLYDSGQLRFTCLGYDPGVTFAQGGIVKNYQFANTPTNSWTISHTVDLSRPTAVTDQGSYFVAYVGNAFQIAIATSGGFIPEPFLLYVQVGLDDYSIFCDLFYALQAEDVAGIKNFTVTKNADVFKVYMDGVELPLATTYGNTMQEALAATKNILLPPDMSVFDDDNLYVNGDLAGPNFYDVTQMTQFPTVTVYNGPFPNWVHSHLQYNAALTSRQVQTLVSLGPDLGLYGYDNGNGTMTLQDTRNRYYVGGFETTDLIFGCLPVCLRNGTNPAPYLMAPDGVKRLKFPLYVGHSAPAGIEGVVAAYEEPSYYFPWQLDYDTGSLAIRGQFGTGDNGYGGVVKNYQTSITPESKFSWSFTFETPDDATNAYQILLVDYAPFAMAAPGNFLICYLSQALLGGLGPWIYLIVQTSNGEMCAIAYDLTPGLSVRNIVISLDSGVCKLFENGVEVPIDLANSTPVPPAPEDTVNKLYYLSTMLGKVPFVFPSDLTTFEDDNLYTHGNLGTPGSYNFSLFTSFPSQNGAQAETFGGTNFNVKFYQHLLYAKALSSDEASTLYNLGADLGGLAGFDNTNGTMRLSDSASRFSAPAVPDGAAVTSVVNPARLSSVIQSMGPDPYFDSAAKIDRAVVYYTHQDGRQTNRILHKFDGATLSGVTTWGPSALDGTWQKTKIKVFDANGAKTIIPRAFLDSTSNDIVHSDGTMSLNV